jgi:hypothetical protein
MRARLRMGAGRGLYSAGVSHAEKRTILTIQKRNNNKIKQIQVAIDRIYAVPDGIGGHRRPAPLHLTAYPGSGGNQGGGGGGNGGGVALTVGDGGGSYLATPAAATMADYTATDETRVFDAEWGAAKAKQDAALDRIGRGVGSLRDMARGMQVGH